MSFRIPPSRYVDFAILRGDLEMSIGNTEGAVDAWKHIESQNPAYLSLVVERIYSVPGIGRQFVDSVSGRDYPLLLGIVLVFALLISLVNLLVDLSYGFLDPRIRYR